MGAFRRTIVLRRLLATRFARLATRRAEVQLRRLGFTANREQGNASSTFDRVVACSGVFREP